MKLELAEIVKRLKRHKPTCEKELLVECGLPLQFIDYGAYRKVYRVAGTPYVLKVPSDCEGIWHSLDETKAVKRLKRSEIAAVLPVFHYSSLETGIILTDLCKTGLLPRFKLNKKVIHEWVIAHGYKDPDVEPDKWDNFGTLNGKLKILDLGCFTKD